MCNDRFLVLLAVPTVQFNAPTAGQQDSPVHFDGALAAELPAYKVGVVRRVDDVVAEGLVHVLVDVEAIEEYGRVVVGH